MAVSRVSLLFLMASAMFVLAAFDGAKAQEAHGVLATYSLYNPQSINWDMRTASTFCATWGCRHAAGVAAALWLDGILWPCR